MRGSGTTAAGKCERRRQRSRLSADGRWGMLSRVRIGGGSPAGEGLSDRGQRASRAPGVDPVCMQSLGSAKGFDVMSKLETATARLNTALDALERNAGSFAAKGAQLSDLQQERETLLRRLAELEEES